MKIVVLGIAVALLFGCTSQSVRRPSPADTLPSAPLIPVEVQREFARFARMDIDGFGIPPVLFVGELDHVDSTSYMNVHGEEWAVVIRVKKVLAGSYSEPIWGYGTSRPALVPFVKGEDYYFVAGAGRHGSLLLHWTPVGKTPEPNKGAEQRGHGSTIGKSANAPPAAPRASAPVDSSPRSPPANSVRLFARS